MKEEKKVGGNSLSGGKKGDGRRRKYLEAEKDEHGGPSIHGVYGEISCHTTCT